MKQTRPCGKFSESQIVSILNSIGKEQSIEKVCREHGISTATFYNWNRIADAKQIR